MRLRDPQATNPRLSKSAHNVRRRFSIEGYSAGLLQIIAIIIIIIRKFILPVINDQADEYISGV
jgi:hypothetical protein